MDGCGMDAAKETAADLDSNNVSKAMIKLMECTRETDGVFPAFVKENEKRWVGADLAIKTDPAGSHGIPVIGWEIY